MTLRQKYDLATAGWCVVAAAVVYLSVAFIGAAIDFPLRTENAQAVLVIYCLLASFFTVIVRSENRPLRQSHR